MKKRILKNTLILLAVTLVAALCLSGVYALTKDKIAEAEAKEREESFKAVMENVSSFNSIPAEKITRYNENARAQSGQNGAEILEARRVLDGSGDFIGVVVSVVSHKGYGGDVVLSLGVNRDGSISGMKVTSMSETSGLGANCQDPEWASQFAGKKTFPLNYDKSGSPEEDEIDAITGATITTKAVLEAVNAGVDYAVRYMSDGGASE